MYVQALTQFYSDNGFNIMPVFGIRERLKLLIFHVNLNHVPPACVIN